jgi:hypothetical protein
MIDKDTLYNNLLTYIGNRYTNCSIPLFPSEKKIAGCKKACEAFCRTFPTEIPGSYQPPEKEPDGNLTARYTFWVKNFTVIFTVFIVRPELCDRAKGAPELNPFLRQLEQFWSRKERLKTT